MHNKIMVVVLGLIFILCLISLKFIGDAQKDYKYTNAFINDINAEAETFKTGANGFLKKYDINELKKNYPEPTVTGEKTLINVPIINQFPELPTGCEITSATAILNYIGFPVDKVAMQENFLASSDKFYYDDQNKRIGPDPSKFFVGNPKAKGLGCFSQVIVDTMNKFFRANSSADYAINLVNADQKTLETLLDNGIPIEVWASKGMKAYTYTNQWTFESTGEDFHWPSNSHVIVLVGYDELNYYFADCDNKTEIQSYEKTQFLTRWEQYNKQGVIVKIK